MGNIIGNETSTHVGDRGVQVQKKSFKMDQLAILVWSYGPTGNINGSCFEGLGVEHGYRVMWQKKKKGDFGLFLK